MSARGEPHDANLIRTNLPFFAAEAHCADSPLSIGEREKRVALWQPVLEYDARDSVRREPLRDAMPLGPSDQSAVAATGAYHEGRAARVVRQVNGDCGRRRCIHAVSNWGLTVPERNGALW